MSYLVLLTILFCTTTETSIFWLHVYPQYSKFFLRFSFLAFCFNFRRILSTFLKSELVLTLQNYRRCSSRSSAQQTVFVFCNYHWLLSLGYRHSNLSEPGLSFVIAIGHPGRYFIFVDSVGRYSDIVTGFLGLYFDAFPRARRAFLIFASLSTYAPFLNERPQCLLKGDGRFCSFHFRRLECIEKFSSSLSVLWFRKYPHQRTRYRMWRFATECLTILSTTHLSFVCGSEDHQFLSMYRAIDIPSILTLSLIPFFPLGTVFDSILETKNGSNFFDFNLCNGSSSFQGESSRK